MTSPQAPVPAQAILPPDPKAPTFSNTDPAGFTGALDQLAGLAAGNEHINDHPGLMNALMQSNATPQQAGAIDQFTAGVKAQNMYQLALEQGGKIVFTPAERSAMDAMGFDYSKVDATASTNQQATIDGLKAKGLVPTVNQDGTLATAADGNIIVRNAPAAAPAAKSGGGGFFSGIGNFFHDLTHNPVTNAMSEGWNIADASVSSDISDVTRAFDSIDQKIGLGNIVNAEQAATGTNPSSGKELSDQRKVEMQAMGYDPNSLWSSLAFDAHGYSKTDIQPALTGWDTSGAPQKYGKSAADILPDALQFLKDPKAYQDQIISDTSLSPEQAGQKLDFLNTPEFQTFARRLAADQGTIGNVAMQNLGVDPIKNAREYQIGSATTDLVASFYLDPTLLLGKTLNVLRKSSIAIKSLYDSERAASILDPAKAGAFGPRRSVINGWQSMIDSANDIRSALANGDSAKAAAAYASIKAKTPALEPLLGDFLGTVSPEFRTTAEGISGLSDHVHQLGVGEPVTNLADAVKYITERGGLLRLAGGKAAVETSYMPGAVSNFGYRALKANIAAGLARRDAVRTAAQETEYLAARNAGNLSAADQAATDSAFSHADPATPTNTIDLSDLKKFLPSAIDGVDMQSGLVVAAPDAKLIGLHVDQVKEALAQVKAAQEAALKSVTTNTNGEQVISDDALAAKAAAGDALHGVQAGLASAIRAAVDRAPTSGDWADALLPAEKGQVAYNLRRYGSAVAPTDASAADAVKGWASPTAVAARARLAAARFTTTLPRNTKFNLADPMTSEKVYKYARFYLGKGSASNLAASFANGDLGTRKAIVEGLWDQVAHAAGLPRTSLGQEMLKGARTTQQAYTHAGPGWLVDGQPIALHDGQVTKALTLDSFKDVQHAASKLGLYEATVGRLGTSQVVDSLFNQFRFGILAAPKTAYRNIIEPYAKAGLDGMFGDAVKARALTYSGSEQLAKLGQKLGIDGMTGEIPESARVAARTHFEDQLANGSKHQQVVARHIMARIEKGDLAAMSGFGRTRAGDMASDMLSHVASFYRNALIRTIPEEELAHADELPQVLPQMAHNFGQQIVADRFDPYGAQGVRDITADGLVPQKIEYNLAAGDHPLLHGHVGDTGGAGTIYKRTGYDLASTDHTIGRARYISALAQRTADSPEVSRAVMKVLRDPEGDLKPVIDALDARKGPRLTAYGTLFRPNDGDGTAIKAITPDEVALGKRQWAQDVVNDFKYMLTTEKGDINQKIADYISEHGMAPDEQWLASNAKNADLPRSVLAPQYEAMPVGGVQNLASALNDLEGKVFNRVVEGSIKRQSSMPFLAAHYLKARAQQDASGILDQMTSHGLDEATASELLKGQAVRQAYVRTEQMIDDPGLKTQFDIVARNLFMFPRAMQAFVRRWGGSLARDPFGARRMMLALEGTEHSGLVYRDQNGELTFTYPGSQVMRDAMVAIGKIPGFQGFAKYPVGMDMTGKLMLAAPGFDQPFRFSMSPMINIPMRGVFSLFPEHADIWNEIDTALNGQLGAGRGITQQVEPSVIQKLLSAENPDERNSAFASAMIGAMAHLQAAGLAPGPNATPSEIDTYKNQLKTQVRNQLFWRFTFGLIAPAPPSSLNENIDQSAAAPGGSGTGSDYSFSIEGIKNLSAEYKSILNATNGDVARASQIFTYLHPEGTAYTIPTTQAGISKAQLPATTESLKWMESNLPFLDKYKSVGAYFLPKPQGQFDNNAYQAQLAIGLRQKKSIDEFYQNIQENQGLTTYYNEYNQYQQVKAQALASGDPMQAKVASQAFSDWKSNFLAQNPFVAEKFATSATNKITGERQVADLSQMVKQGQVPDGLGPQVSQMLTIWNEYDQWKTANTGSSVVSSGTRQAAADWVDQQLGAIAQSDPRLANIYNGVFRVIDSSLSKIG
jgi:hypothetical protein